MTYMVTFNFFGTNFLASLKLSPLLPTHYESGLTSMSVRNKKHMGDGGGGAHLRGGGSFLESANPT